MVPGTTLQQTEAVADRVAEIMEAHGGGFLGAYHGRIDHADAAQADPGPAEAAAERAVGPRWNLSLQSTRSWADC